MIHSEHVATPVPKCRLLGRLALEGWQVLQVLSSMWRKFPGILIYPDFFSSDSCGRSLWAFRSTHFSFLAVHLSRRFLLSSKVGASRPGGILAPALTTQLGWWSVVLKVRTMACLAMAVPCTATNHPEYTMYIYLDNIAAHNARMPLYKDKSISRWCATKTFRTQTLKGPKNRIQARDRKPLLRSLRSAPRGGHGGQNLMVFRCF